MSSCISLSVFQEDASGRRFFLQQDKTQSLSNVLRELRANQDATESHPPSGRPLMGYGTTTMERFNTNFVSLFEKSEGMVHLEGLELLSQGREQSVGAYATSDRSVELQQEKSDCVAPLCFSIREFLCPTHLLSSPNFFRLHGMLPEV